MVGEGHNKPRTRVDCASIIGLLQLVLLVAAVPCFAAYPLLSKLEVQGSSRGLMVVTEADGPFGLEVRTMKNGGGNSVVVLKLSNVIYGLEEFAFEGLPAACPFKSAVSRVDAPNHVVEFFLKFQGTWTQQARSRQKGGAWLVLLSSTSYPEFSWSPASAPKASVAASPKPPAAAVPSVVSVGAKTPLVAVKQPAAPALAPRVKPESVASPPAAPVKSPQPTAVPAPTRPTAASESAHPTAPSESHAASTAPAAPATPAAKPTLVHLVDVRSIRRGTFEQVILQFDAPVRAGAKRLGDSLLIAFSSTISNLSTTSFAVGGTTVLSKVVLESVNRETTTWLKLTVAAHRGYRGVFTVIPNARSIAISVLSDTLSGLSLWSAQTGLAVSYAFAPEASRSPNYDNLSRKAEVAMGTELKKDQTFTVREPRPEPSAPSRPVAVDKPAEPAPKAPETVVAPPPVAPVVTSARQKTPAAPPAPPVKTVAAVEPQKSVAPPPAPPAKRPVAALPERPSAPPATATRTRPTVAEKPIVKEVPRPVRLVAIKDDVNLRREAGATSKESIVAKLPLGTIGTQLEKKTTWFKLETPLGAGWISGTVVQDSATVPQSIWLKIAERRLAQESARKADIVASLQQRAPGIPQPAAGTLPVAVDTAYASGASKVDSAATVSRGPVLIEYHAYGRDPFMPVLSSDEEETPLAGVTNVDLVGILYDDEDRVALFEDRKIPGKAYALRENDPVKDGKVLKIQREDVVFLLTEFDVSRTVTVHLKKARTTPAQENIAGLMSQQAPRTDQYGYPIQQAASGGTAPVSPGAPYQQGNMIVGQPGGQVQPLNPGASASQPPSQQQYQQQNGMPPPPGTIQGLPPINPQNH